jgi:hypothetical protein
MRTLAEDTSAEMEAVLVSLWRKRTPAQKLDNIVSLRRMAKQLMLGNIRSLHPAADEGEVSRRLLARCFGEDLASEAFSNGDSASRREAEMLSEMQVIALVAGHLDALQIPYYVGGGIACINYGEPRLTNDADLIIRIKSSHIPLFVKSIESDFVVSIDAVQDAFFRKHAFNIIHIQTAFKIDFYPVAEDDAPSNAAFTRRQLVDIGTAKIWMASAEDVILAKLQWFRKDGEISEKQWRDVLGVVGGLGSMNNPRWRLFACFAGCPRRSFSLLCVSLAPLRLCVNASELFESRETHRSLICRTSRKSSRINRPTKSSRR